MTWGANIAEKMAIFVADQYLTSTDYETGCNIYLCICYHIIM